VFNPGWAAKRRARATNISLAMKTPSAGVVMHTASGDLPQLVEIAMTRLLTLLVGTLSASMSTPRQPPQPRVGLAARPLQPPAPLQPQPPRTFALMTAIFQHATAVLGQMAVRRWQTGSGAKSIARARTMDFAIVA